MNRAFVPILALAAATAPLTAFAQAPGAAPTRIRGAIESVTPTSMVVKTRTGTDATIALPESARVVAVTRAHLSDIKSGTYVGTAAVPKPGGGLQALEVVVFPEAMRGTGEGHRPWDLLPESTMTNATVADTVKEANGPVLTLSYKGGEQSVTVPPDAPIVGLTPATRADLKPGAKVVATVTKAADGAETAASVVVGRDGVDPPM